MKLYLQDLCKRFEKKIIFNHVDFTFEKGKIYGLLGRNGTGKMTLFNCIAQNMAFDSGKIGLATDEHTTHWHYDNTDIGFAYTQPHLPDFMTAYEFIKFYLEINQHRLAQPKSPTTYLDEIGIAKEDQHRLLKDFSHGMKHKVQLLVIMLLKPPVLLLDEPLTSFDIVAAHEMKEQIIRAKQDSIVIFSTHILQLAQDLCDEIVLLHHQQLTKVDDLKTSDLNFEEKIIHLLSETDNKGENPQ